MSKPFPVANAVPLYQRKDVGLVDIHCSTTEPPAKADMLTLEQDKLVLLLVIYHLVEDSILLYKALHSINTNS